MIINGVVLNTAFLVGEIRHNDHHDAFINAVTHELKTPVADRAAKWIVGRWRVSR
jgi:two-component system sensor histidine kinase SenX3